MIACRIEAQFTSDTIKTVSRRFVLRLLGAGYFVALTIMAIALAYLTSCRVNDSTTGAIGAVLGMGVLFPAALWRKTERGGLKRLRRMTTPHVILIFDDKGVTADSELGAATVGWKSIEKIWEFPEAWLLFVGKQQYVTIPISALTENLKKCIKAKVEENNTGG